ncbi:hypothetical protein JVU11DRAFT_5116 [Chiua virens]|nr:hypothetical protein JVU11DRAFT_5116 [Chiua virens]
MKMPYPPIELHGFPPWQVTLTEFQCVWLASFPPGPDYIKNSRTDPNDNKECEPPGLISETAFCRALDEYAGAEFRLGR